VRVLGRCRPLVAALRENISIDSWWDGKSPRTFPGRKIPIKNSGASCPGGCPLWQAVQNSMNTPMFAVTMKIGQQKVIEFARDVIGTGDANSTEFDMFTEHPVIDFMPDQRELEDKGGTMRLGLYPARLTPGSKAAEAYGQEVIYERHRHRFEVNNRYRQTLEQAGMLLSGQSPDGRLVEIVELKDHPWFVASQFHPEFKSRPERPHPLFDGFVAAALGKPTAMKAAERPASGTAKTREDAVEPQRAV